MPVVEVMLYLSVILSGRCFNGALPAEVTPAPGGELVCHGPIVVEPPTPPVAERRPPFLPPPPRPCGCEKDDRPEPKPVPLLFLPKIILEGHL